MVIVNATQRTPLSRLHTVNAGSLRTDDTKKKNAFHRQAGYLDEDLNMPVQWLRKGW